MRIAITTPTTWPYVRRGVERFVNELAAYLASRGHEATIISTKPGRGLRRQTGGYTTLYLPSLWISAFAKLGIWEFHTFFLNLLPHLLRTRYDVIHCCTFLDTIAASMARKFSGTPCVCWVNAVHPPVSYVRSLSTGGRIFALALQQADQVVALSGYMQARLSDRFGLGGKQIPVPVDTRQFRLQEGRDQSRPMILCTASLDDARKGGLTLMRAFNVVKRSIPRARLVISATISRARQRELTAEIEACWRPDVEFRGAGQVADLPALYGSASALVLCSRWESFGMVVLEALATGTPVVGTNDGAIPELINRPEIGRLFDPGPEGSVEAVNVHGLAAAICEVLALSADRDTARRCRARAEEFSWDQIGPEFEALYTRLSGAHPIAAPVVAKEI